MLLPSLKCQSIRNPEKGEEADSHSTIPRDTQPYTVGSGVEVLSPGPA